MMKLRTVKVAAVVALALSAMGAQAAKTLVYCSEGSPEGFDSARYTAGTTFDASSHTVGNRLVEFERGTTKVVPALATSWEMSADGLTYTFKLRPGVKFHTTEYFKPTRDFNADDVVLTFERQLKKDHPYNKAVSPAPEYPYFGDMGLDTTIKSVEKVDPLTVRFVLNKPSATFLADIALPPTGTVISAEYVNKLLAEGKANELNNAPIGTGAFVFKRYEKDAQIRFAANPTYWDKGIPKIDKIDMRIIPEVATGVRAMVAGEADMVVAVPPVQRTVLDRSGKATVYVNPSLYLHMVYLDYSRPPLNDVRVRRALNLAVDRNAFNSAAMAGLGEPATTLFPKDYWPHDPALTGLLAYDPDKARALMKEVGAEVTVTGFTYSDQAAVQRGELLVEMWSKVGIKAKMRGAATAEASASFFGQRTTDMFLAALTSRPDPSMGCYILFNKDSFYNGGHQEIPGMEAALAESRAGATQEQRKAALSKVQRIACEQAVFLPLVFDASVIAVSKKFTGFQPNIFGRPRYETLAPAKS